MGQCVWSGSIKLGHEQTHSGFAPVFWLYATVVEVEDCAARYFIKLFLDFFRRLDMYFVGVRWIVSIRIRDDDTASKAISAVEALSILLIYPHLQ